MKKNTLLTIISFLSILVLIEVLYFFYTFTQKPIRAQSYLTRSELINHPSNSCIVHEPTYTLHELKKIFAPNTYKSCKTTTKDIVKFDKSSLSVSCELNEPLYFVDPGDPQEFGGSENLPVTWSKNFDLNNKSEFLFVNCGKKSVYSFIFNRFNPEISEKANKIREDFKGQRKNFNVFFLVFDSLSRFVSYNFLPRFTEYMRKTLRSPSSNYSVYEFTKIALPEEYTIPNMAPMLYGESWNHLRNTFTSSKPEPSEEKRYRDYQKSNSIWNYYSRLGYTTLFLYDTSWDFLSRFVGKNILADHVFQNFWKYAWNVYGWHDFSSKQRCMGLENSHNMSFTYVYDYFSNYKDNNKFAYVHLSPTHESSGNVQTLDKELKNFVKSILKLMQDRDEDLVFFVLSDHGWKYPGLILDERYHAETLSPMTYLILDKNIESSLEAKQILEHNSNQLISRFDFYLTLKYIAQIPYNFPANLAKDLNKKNFIKTNVENIMKDKISTDRTCLDLNIYSHRCICTWYKEFDTSIWYEKRFLDKSEELILQFFQTREKNGCGRVEGIKLKSGKKMIVQPENKGSVTFYQLHYEVNAQIEMIAKLSYAEKENVKKPYHISVNKYRPVLEYSKGGVETLIQLTEVKLSLGCGDQSCMCHVQPNIILAY